MSANLQSGLTPRRQRHRRRPSAAPLPLGSKDCFPSLPGELVVGPPRRKQVRPEILAGHCIVMSSRETR
jgi:hypothetical protein